MRGRNQFDQLVINCVRYVTIYGTYLKLSLFLSKTVADCLKLSRSSKIVAMCLNLLLILSHVPAPKAHTSQGTIHGYVHSWKPGTTRPNPILTHPARSSRTTRPAPACPPSSTRPAMPADPARQARRPGPRCPPTRPSVPPDPARRAPDPARRARRPGQPCPQTRPAKLANPPSRADQPGHVRCFGHDAVDPASLVSSSFLLISAS